MIEQLWGNAASWAESWGGTEWALIGVTAILAIVLLTSPGRQRKVWGTFVGIATFCGAVVGLLVPSLSVAVDPAQLEGRVAAFCRAEGATDKAFEICVQANMDALSRAEESGFAELDQARALIAEDKAREAEARLLRFAQGNEKSRGERRSKAAAAAYAVLGARRFHAQALVAIGFYEKARALDPLQPDYSVYLAQLYERTGKPDMASDLYGFVHALPALNDRRSMRLRAMALRRQADILRERGQLTISAKASRLEQALKLFEEAGDKHAQADILGELAVTAMVQFDLVTTEAYLKRALELFEELNLKQRQAETLANLGSISLLGGDPKAAVNYFARALKLYEQLGGKKEQAAILQELGNAAKEAKDLVAAEDYYSRALKLVEELGDNEAQAKILNLLGVVNLARDNRDAAEDYYKRSLRLFEELGHEEGQARNLHDLGVIYLGRKDYSTAEDYFQRALKLFEKMDHQLGLAVTLYNLGQLDEEHGNQAEACKKFDRSAKLLREMMVSDDDNLARKSLLERCEQPVEQSNRMNAVSFHSASVRKANNCVMPMESGRPAVLPLDACFRW